MVDQERPFDQLPDGVIVVGPDGRITAANPAALRLARTRDPVGRALDDAFPLRDADGRAWYACTATLRAMPAVRAVPVRELTLDTGTGRRAVDLTATFVRGAGGGVVETICCLRDARSRSRSETGRGNLIATLAHDLRSPLTSVKGFTATLLARWDRFNDDTKLHMLRTIGADADRIARLIRELVDVSRIDAGRLELQRRPVDLAPIVLALPELLAQQQAPRPVQVRVEPGIPELDADPAKLANAIELVAEQAVHAPGSRPVVVSVRREGAWVEIEIADPDDDRPYAELTRAFSKLGRRGGYGLGTGLGCFIAKGLVEAHGGEALTRPTGGGAAMVLRLPLPREAVAEAATEPAGDPVAGS